MLWSLAKQHKGILASIFAMVLVAVFAVTLQANAQANYMINYQGKLTDDVGATVADATYDMYFRLYTAPVGGSAIWTEYASTSVSSGLFSHMLGTSTSLSSVDFNQTLYLGVTINTDSEMSPRKVLGAVPAAFEAENAQTLDNLATSSFLRADQADTASGLLTFSNGFISQASSTAVEFSAVNATTTNLHISGNLYDVNSSAGTTGYVMQVTASGIQWVATSSLGITSGSAITFGTDNQIPFTNAGGTDFDYSGNFTFDGSTLSVQTTGTADILNLFETGGTEVFTVLENGNVGIGTTSPESLLTVYGNALLEGSNRYLNFGSLAGSGGYGIRDNNGTLEYRNSDYSAWEFVGGPFRFAADPDAYDITNRSDNGSFDVSGQDTTPYGITFNTDGTKMYIVGLVGQDINEYALSTAFDVTSATFTVATSTATQETAPRQVQFNTAGTKMFVIGTGADAVHEYALSSAFDVSSAAFTVSTTTTGQNADTRGLAFNSDGTKMFVTGFGSPADQVYEYTLSSGFDVSTAAYVDAYTLTAANTNPRNIAFNSDGTQMFITDAGTDNIYEHSLSSGFDISTASYLQSVDINPDETSLLGIAFNTDGSKLYTAGDGSGAVNQWTLSSKSIYYSPNSVAIGTSTSLGTLTVAGSAVVSGAVTQLPTNPVVVGTVSDLADLNGIDAIAVAGNYVYAVAATDDSLRIIDVSDPTNPTIVGGVKDSVNLNGPTEVAVSGRYAYVINLTSDSLQVIDVSDVAKPVLLGKVHDATRLGSPRRLSVVGSYAYVTSYDDNSLQIIDVSDPNNPTFAGEVQDAVNLTNPVGVAVSGRYAYVTSFGDDSLQIIDISDPTNPAIVGGVQDSNDLNGAQGVAVSGRYAYVTNYVDDSFRIIDVSSSTNPVIVGGVQDAVNLQNATQVKVAGQYAYVVSILSNSLRIIDVSSSTNPVIVGGLLDSINLHRVEDLEVVGRYAYVMSGALYDSVSVIDLQGTRLATAEIDSLEAGSLSVLNNATFDQSLDIRSGLNVGHNALIGGQLSISGISSSTDTVNQALLSLGGDTDRNSFLSFLGRNSSTSANVWSAGLNQADGSFRIASSTGLASNSYLTISKGGNIGIGTTSPAYKLDIYGDARIDGDLYDTTGSAGVAGYVLQSTASGLTWVATSSLGLAAGTSSHAAVTLAGTPNYITLSGQQLTLTQLDLADDLAAFSSANLLGKLSDETGTGFAVFSDSPTFTGTITAALANFSGTTTFATSTFTQIGITGSTDGTASLLAGDGALNINNTGNNDVGFQVYTNNGAGQFDPLVVIRNDNAAFDEGLLYLSNDGTSGNAYNIRIDGVGPQIEFVETDQTAPYGKWEIQANGQEFGFNSRQVGDDAFERYFYLNGPLWEGGQMVLNASSSSATRDLFVIENQVSSAGARPGFAWSTVGGGGTTHARLSASGGASHNNSKFYIQVADSGQTLQERVAIDVDGNFGIGTTTPGYTLDVYGDARIDGDLYDTTGSAGVAGYVLQSTASGLTWVATSSLGLAAGTSSHAAVTLAGQDYLTLSGQQITAGEIEPDDLANSDFGDFSCNGTTCSFDIDTIGTAEMADEDHGDFSYSGGSATLDDDVVGTAEMANADFGAFTFSGGLATLDNDVVTPDDVLSNQTGADEFCLTYESSGDTWEWQSCSGGSVTSVAASVPAGWTISGTPITDSGTLAFSYDTGYGAVLTASTSNWNSFYQSPASVITAGTGLSWSSNTINLDNDFGADIGPTELASGDFGSFTCNGSTCTLDDLSAASSTLNASGWQADYVLQASSTASGGMVWVATSSLGFAGGGSSVTFGTDSQIPFMNSGDTDFQYTSNFSFNETTDTLTIGNLTLADGLIAHTGAATTTIANGLRNAWTIATSTTATPIISISTDGAAEVTFGTPGGEVLIGSVGTASNLVFEESSTIGGQGENTITFGEAGDIFNFAVNLGIGSTSPSKELSIEGDMSLTGGLYDSAFSAGTEGMVLWSTGTSTRWVATSTLNIASNLWFQNGGLIYSDIGDVGIGVTDPDKRLEVFETVSDAQLKVSYDATRYAQFQVDSVGDLIVDAQGGDIRMNDENLWVCAGGSCPSGTPAGTGNLIVETAVGIGTSSPRDALEVWDDIYVAGGGATGLGQSTSTFQGDVLILGKLDVGTIDPVYTIGGTKYATYGMSSIGIKEEATANLNLEEYNSETGYYEYRIAWSELSEASDLWLFYQVTEFGEKWNKLVVALTAGFADSVFYEKDLQANALVIKSKSAGEVSARFSADRFDAEKWSNVRPDQDSDVTHFTLPGKE